MKKITTIIGLDNTVKNEKEVITTHDLMYSMLFQHCYEIVYSIAKTVLV